MNDNSLNDLKKHLFIVIGYEHYTPLGVVRSLGEIGIRPILIVKKGRARVVSKSKYLSRIIYVNSVEEQFEILIKEFGNCSVKPYVFPCDDAITEYIDCRFDLIKDRFYVSNAKEANRISYFLDKNNINIIAQKYGLNVAKSWVVDKGVIPSDIIYPIITKTISSNSGAWKKDYHICNNDEELLKAYESIKSEKLLLQQYIYKETEVCLDGVSISNGNNVLYAIASTYTYSLPDYYSAEMIVTNSNTIPNSVHILSALDGIFKEIAYDGIFSVEFMLDKNGQMWFLEINFRTSTWLYASTKLGMNLPFLWVYGQEYGELPDNSEKKIPPDYIAMAELVDFSFRVTKHRIALSEWIKECRKCQCFFFYNKNDKKPFYYSIWNKVMDKFDKLTGRS